MKFEQLLVTLGIVLVVFSFALGDWSIWLGAPLAFFGIILQYRDQI